MTNSTFKPTHVRCVVGDGRGFSEGNIYRIEEWFDDQQHYVVMDTGEGGVIFNDEYQSVKKHTAKYPLFRYVGPPAILGDPIND